MFQKFLGWLKGPKVLFQRDAEMDALVEEFRRISAIGTGISLDGDGLTEQWKQEHYYQPLSAFLEHHGQRLMEYLKPYRGVQMSELVRGQDYFDLHTAFELLSAQMEARSRNQ